MLTRILVARKISGMEWRVELKESVIDDLRWFGKRDGKQLLKEALRRLEQDPLLESRQMKTLRPNPVADRELRLFGKYRVLFNVDEASRLVMIVLVGEKRGQVLIVQGQEFTEHHESNPAE
jgi:mRNA-degrading endonuclease RelE of RelBE toxin-antitoxin system